MSVPLKDRPLAQVKEEIIDQLILNYSHGEISAQAFERRLDQAYDCSCQEQLATLVADLPLHSDPRYNSEKAARMRTPFTQSSEQVNGEKITAILSSDQRSGEWVVPKEIHLNNYLGSIELDFTNAIFSHPEVHIYVNCILGSDEIVVPENVDVQTQTTNIMGSLVNKRVSLGPRYEDKQRPCIIIHGRIILGSVEVSIKRTMKEKLKAFAFDLRDLFDGREQGKSRNRYDG